MKSTSLCCQERGDAAAARRLVRQCCAAAAVRVSRALARIAKVLACIALAPGLVLAASTLVPTKAAAESLACRPPLRAMQQFELLFGRNIGSRIGVSEAAWSRFLAREVTPRFSAGLTVVDAAGQWRDGRGRIGREPGKLVMIVAPDTATTDRRAAAIAAAYERQFGQQSVVVIARPVCAGF